MFNRISRAPPLIPFGIQTQVFFSDTRRQKRQPAGEAGRLSSLNEYFGDLPLPPGRRNVEIGHYGQTLVRGAF